jgi:hypothetical protein
MVDTNGLGGAERQPLPQVVAPGERVTIVVALTALTPAGTYRADFLLENDRGGTFGIGASGTSPVYVRIQVLAETPPPGATPGSTQAAGCTYQAAFVKETIPDNSKFYTGEIFIKSWTVKNTGTCIWEGIRLPWVEGASGSLWFPPGVPRVDNPHGDVAPGETFTLGWPIVVPPTPGTYRADFLLAVADDTQFGLGKDGKTPLYVQIIAVQGPSPMQESELGLPAAPDLRDTFDRNDPAWWKPDSGPVEVTTTGGELVFRAQQKTYFWTVRAMPVIRGHVTQAVFKTRDNCTGSHAFGLMVGLDSANNPRNGHLLRVTCDGKYSVGFADHQNIIQPLIPETAHSAILAGPNQTNRLTIISTGGLMSFYANGVKLASLNLLDPIELEMVQYENGAVTGQSTQDMRDNFFYTDLPYNQAGIPGLYFENAGGTFTLAVDEFSFWNLESLVK